MLIKLIKTREVISGAHCEVWEINPLLEDRLMAEVFVLNEHLPLELIYRLTVTMRGMRIRGRDIGWQWDEPEAEQEVYEYLKEIQLSGEEIYLEVCVPEPDLPGYPYIDRHPDDYPIVLTDEMIVLMDDLDEDERPEEPIYEPFEEVEYV
jgi:hypothetical protein